MIIQISNLHLDVKNADLSALFTPFGQVDSATIAIDAFTDKSRGFGFVEMPDGAEAVKAIETLNKSVVHEMEVTVQEVPAKSVQKGSYKVGDPSVRNYQFRTTK